jgi:hypothetical protein
MLNSESAHQQYIKERITRILKSLDNILVRSYLNLL